MDIPEYLSKNVNVANLSKFEMIEAILIPEKSGVIIKWAAFFDAPLLVDVLLAYRQADPPYSEAKVRKMSLAEKAKALAGFSMVGEPASLRERALRTLNPLILIRNRAAHDSSLHVDMVEELYGNAGVRELLDDFPSVLESRCKETQQDLQRLMDLPEFRSPT